MTCEIINEIENIEDYSYLELGVHDNTNFNKIKCRNKHSVDMNGKALFTGTTDEYFSQTSKDTRYDIVFIDANHDYEYVVKDFNNSIKICDKLLILHDMVPPDKAHTASNRCSDSYKVLYHLKKFTKLEVFTLNHNCGLTFVKMPGTKIKLNRDTQTLSYEDFYEFTKGLTFYSDQQMVEILRGLNV